MEQAVRTETRRSGVAEADDPFRYGWRYVRRTQPDGTTVIDEIPLTRDDLLYPEEGDFVVQEPWHTQDFTYCYSALTAWFAAQSNVVVLGDCRVDWGVPGIRPLGPDIVVLYEGPALAPPGDVSPGGRRWHPRAGGGDCLARYAG